MRQWDFRHIPSERSLEAVGKSVRLHIIGTVSIRSRDTAKTETMTLDNFTLKSQMKSKIVYKKEPDTQTQSL